MIATLVLYGATGDLAGRYLLPALAALRGAGELPEDFRVVGAAREALDDEAYRRLAAHRLGEHASEIPAAARDALLRALWYRQVDVADAASVRRALGEGTDAVAVYLALPPVLFAPAIGALEAVGLPEGSRIAVEKPFGDDLAGAVELNALLARVAGATGEQAVFRVDHVLGMATVQDLIALRFANRVLAPLWDSTHIERVELLWEETIALEGRAGYFDRAGALKDVLQNHVLQLLSLVAMEPPPSLSAQDLHERKVEALRSVRQMTRDDVLARTRRARYTAGRLANIDGTPGREVPDYAAEDGVDPARGTETFAEITLELDSQRWAGTPFVLRGGKALAARRKAVGIYFKPASQMLFAADAADRVANQLWIGIDGPEDITLHLTGGPTRPPGAPAPLILTGRPPGTDIPAYGRVLLDLLGGGASLSVRGDEAEEAWRIVMPVLDGWAEGAVPLEEYEAGSSGPAPGPRHD